MPWILLTTVDRMQKLKSYSRGARNATPIHRIRSSRINAKYTISELDCISNLWECCTNWCNRPQASTDKKLQHKTYVHWLTQCYMTRLKNKNPECFSSMVQVLEAIYKFINNVACPIPYVHTAANTRSEHANVKLTGFEAIISKTKISNIQPYYVMV